VIAIRETHGIGEWSGVVGTGLLFRDKFALRRAPLRSANVMLKRLCRCCSKRSKILAPVMNKYMTSACEGGNVLRVETLSRGL